GYHGVLEEERRDGQRFLYDVWLDVGDGVGSDRIEDAADYRDVVACVRELNDVPRQLLETLATAVAETLLERFDVERVRVRVRRPALRPQDDRPRPAPLRRRAARRARPRRPAPAAPRARLRARAARRAGPGPRRPGPRPPESPALTATIGLMSHIDDLDEFE